MNRTGGGTLTRWNTGRTGAEQIADAKHAIRIAREEIDRLEARIAEELAFIARKAGA